MKFPLSVSTLPKNEPHVAIEGFPSDKPQAPPVKTFSIRTHASSVTFSGKLATAFDRLAAQPEPETWNDCAPFFTGLFTTI